MLFSSAVTQWALCCCQPAAVGVAAADGLPVVAPGQQADQHKGTTFTHADGLPVVAPGQQADQHKGTTFTRAAGESHCTFVVLSAAATLPTILHRPAYPPALSWAAGLACKVPLNYMTVTRAIYHTPHYVLHDNFLACVTTRVTCPKT